MLRFWQNMPNNCAQLLTQREGRFASVTPLENGESLSSVGFQALEGVFVLVDDRDLSTSRK
jgi:hypothetical protein